MKGILTMSQKEVDRIKILHQFAQKSITAAETSEFLQLSIRQVYRLVQRINKEGDKGIIHKLRGRSSNRGYPKETKNKVISIYRKQYWDYGPTLFSEELLKSYNISINHETLRRWMRQEAITTSLRKKRPHRKRRERRSGFGEMLQFDGCHHDWFEGRGAECCLFNCIDDSTGRVFLRFACSENTADAMLTMWEYLTRHGRPISLYLDRHSVYKAENVLTDFARAMKELDIELIYAKSPQAKGRVERGNRTLQDRLTKALRQKDISTTAEANQFLEEEFIEEYNNRFAVNPDALDIHRSIEGIELEKIFCYKTNRQVRNDYTISLDGRFIQLLRGEAPLPKVRQDVTVSLWLDDSMHIIFNDQQLNFEILKAKPAKKKDEKVKWKPAKDHPWKKMNNRLPGSKRTKLRAQHSGNSSRVTPSLRYPNALV